MVHPVRRTILCRHGRLECTARTLQKRTIGAYLRDVWRSGSLVPTNPLLETFKAVRTDDCATDASSLPDHVQVLPQFALVAPNHVTAAAQLVRENRKQSLAEIQEFFRNVKVNEDEQQPSKTPATGTAEQQLEELLLLLNNAEESLYTLQQISALLWVMSREDDKDMWESAATECSMAAEVSGDSDVGALIYEKLRLLLADLDCSSSERAKELRRAANTLLTKYERETGQRVFVPMDDDESSEAMDARLETYKHLSIALQEVEQSLTSTTQGFVKPQLLADMYNYIGLRHELAKSLGYRHFCEQVLSHRQAQIDEIHKLCDDLAARLVPQIVEDVGVKKSQEELELEAYLSQKNKAAAEVEHRHKSDRYFALKLEDHVTLDGALQFLFRMIHDLFGLSFILEDKDNANGWNTSVMLYHVFDEHNKRQYMGSFYIDPFARKGKLGREATIPIFPRGLNRQPVACLCLKAEAPAWDIDPVNLKWHDCEALFHEMGHVLQFVMSRPKQGTIMGPQTMALDISEILPKFMELFLTEKSTLYTLIDLSKSTYPLSDDEIDIAFRVRAREKALHVAQLTFYSKLELEIFSGFDLKGSETIVALQERLGKVFIPHDVPDPDDATPLLDILQDNAKGQHVARYRYLWCEVVGAAVYEKFKQTYATDPSGVPALGMKLRRLVLEPGANVEAKTILSEFGIGDYSTDLLCERYGL